ncbi:DUF6192 family protein [Streptomyces sp. HMX112]|uniref:DUF6192 family protein n=1 Tax=Streptomyces sp. HMX112 TaxID=3390850 RepID=UPI003A7FB60F
MGEPAQVLTRHSRWRVASPTGRRPVGAPVRPSPRRARPVPRTTGWRCPPASGLCAATVKDRAGRNLFTSARPLTGLAETSARNGAPRRTPGGRHHAGRGNLARRGCRPRFTGTWAVAPDEEEGFAAVETLPGAESRWAVDEADRRVGRQVESPASPTEKIIAMHTLGPGRGRGRGGDHRFPQSIPATSVTGRRLGSFVWISRSLVRVCR